MTINDVAKHAGVSVSTVSYALSGKRAISEATRERVSRSVRELGYRPNASAQALASKRVSALALVAPLRADNNVPVMMQFVAAVATAARERQHDLLLITDEDGSSGVERLAHAGVVDAVIVMDVQEGDARFPLLRSLDMPSVLIGRPAGLSGLSCVDLDLHEAGAVLVDHVADQGHRAIGILGSPQTVYERRSTYATGLRDGLQAAARRRGLASVFVPMDQRFEAVVAGIDRVLTEEPSASALIVHNEAMLSTVLAALERRGLRVPLDISVVAFCPDDMAASQRVPLTNVAVPAEEVGQAAVAMALDLVEDRTRGGTRLFLPTLTPRDSVARRAARQEAG